MPVLPPEPILSPEDLFSEGSETSESAAGSLWGERAERWWVLHTRPRAEKALARRLYRERISFFLPLHERRRRVQRRLVCSFLPVFPSYLFLRGSEWAVQTAYETNFVVNCLRVVNQEELHADLNRVYRMIGSGAPVWPEERLKPGMPAEIVSGPLAGHRGEVLRVGQGEHQTLKFVVAVNFLQQGAAVEVNEAMVQPL